MSQRLKVCDGGEIVFIARVFCPACTNWSDFATEDDQHFATCPVCGQNNAIKSENVGREIDGRCGLCHKPLDSGVHDLARDGSLIRCRG